MLNSLKKDLQDFLEALNENANSDWSENDPVDEFETLSIQLEGIINKPRFEEEAIERLSQMVSHTDAEGNQKSPAELLKMLAEQSEINGEVRADEVATMWEPFENYFTVNELLEQIGL